MSTIAIATETEEATKRAGEMLEHASDHLYHYVTPYTASADFAAIDLLDDLRADLGVL